jgi:erythromycin esterase-like protein
VYAYGLKAAPPNPSVEISQLPIPGPPHHSTLSSALISAKSEMKLLGLHAQLKHSPLPSNRAYYDALVARFAEEASDDPAAVAAADAAAEEAFFGKHTFLERHERVLQSSDSLTVTATASASWTRTSPTE